MQLWLYGFATLLEAVLVVALIRRGLHRIYRAFFAFLLVKIVLDAVELGLLVTRAGGNAYAHVWMASVPLFAVLYFLVVRELFRLVLEDYPSIATAGKRAMWAALAVALGVAFWINPVNFEEFMETARRLGLFSGILRTTSLTLALFLFLITVFIVFFPLELRKNIITYTLLFFIYFTATTLALQLEVGDPAVRRYVNLAMLGVHIACLGSWIALLRAAGEKQLATFSRTWQPQGVDEVALLEQLRAINSALGGLSATGGRK